MKKIYLALVFVLIAFTVRAQAPFVTTWEVDSSDLSITIPTTGTGYNYTVDFGDGTVETNVVGNKLHIYSTPGIYTVTISGSFPRIYFAGINSFEASNLNSIEQWGDQQWTSMERAFEGCSNLIINAMDAPDLSEVTSLRQMFKDASTLNQSINHWDVSNITDMSFMFSSASSFNQPLNNWDVSNVGTLNSMFIEASLFNQPLNTWDVSNVNNMSYMFSLAINFNQPLDLWNVSSVATMKGMFSKSILFNQSLSNWQLSNVSDVSYMFQDADNFNQNINNWDVSNVTDMSYMFSNGFLSEPTVFNQPIDNWDVSSVVNMKGMFSAAIFFDQSLNSWNVSNVINMSEMFKQALIFNQPINNWNVSNVTDMSYMFKEALVFNQNIGNWDVSNVTDMSYMFESSYYVSASHTYNKFNQPIGNWDVSNVVNMEGMFKNSEFNQDINNWNVLNVTNMNIMFASTNSFNLPLDSWDVSNVVSMEGMFEHAQNFNQDLSNWNFNGNVSFGNFIFNTGLNISNYEILLNRFRILNLQDKNLNAERLIYCNDTDRLHLVNDLGWNIANDNKLINCSPLTPGAFVTRWEIPSFDLDLMIFISDPGYNYTIDFGDGTVLTNQTNTVLHTYSTPGVYSIAITGSFPRIHLSSEPRILSVEQWGDIQWATMLNAFNSCANLKINATDAPDLSQVTVMSSMFASCKFNQSINHWDVSNVTNMSDLFAGMPSFNQSLENWDVANVVDMSLMFYDSPTYNQPLNGWDVSNVTDMFKMFYEASSFNQPLDSWNVSNVSNMEEMFSRAISFNQSLNDWDMSNVTTIDGMFSMARDFNQPLDNWNVSNLTTLSDVFAGAHSFNQPLNNWDVSNVIGFFQTFFGALSFNQPLDNWNVSNSQSFTYMFEGAKSFNQPLNNWDVSNATNMYRMFSDAEDFNQPLDNWDVSNIQIFDAMFWGAKAFNQPLNDWDVSSSGNMSRMFSDAENFNQPLDNWDVSNVHNTSFMFINATAFNQPLDNWDVSNVTNMMYMFNNATAFNQPLNNWQINTVNLNNFIADSGMDVANYDALLSSLATIGNADGELYSFNLFYCNSGARDYLINNLGWNILGDFLSSNCNNVTGTILYDETNNGCDVNDIGISGFMVNANDGIYDITTFSNNGLYSLSTNETTLTVTLINYPDHFTADPISANVVFTGSNTEVVDFCVTANQTIADLNITLLPITEARPGFEAGYQIVVENRGTHSVSDVSINLVFDEAMQTFVTASPAPTTTTTNELTFAVSNLPAFGQQLIDVTMATFAPPIVEGGDILNFTATVTPNTNDNTPEDNTFVYEQIVVNSFDPNDKLVLQGEEIYLEEVDEYLHYIIRFQNTGTASAINVRILDTLHPKLDWTSILPINASHGYHVEITEGNRVEFIFDDINLPHTEPESHGFVAYKIKPKSEVQVGDVITGDASIYFDFNPPIVTNTVSTTVIDNLSVEENNINNLSIYPVPAGDVLNIRSATAITKVQIYNELGQVLLTWKETEGIDQIDIEKLSRGIYFVKLMDADDNNVVRKIIKG